MLKKLFDGFWEYGTTKILLKDTIEKMKTWDTKKAQSMGIDRRMFKVWKDNNFEETKRFLIIDNPSLVEDVPQFEVKKFRDRHLIKEVEWDKIKKYVGLNTVYVRILSDNLKVKDSGRIKNIEYTTVYSWIRGTSHPWILPDTDYASIYKILTQTENEQTLMMSAGLGLLEGAGGFAREDTTVRWRSEQELNVMSSCTGPLPKPKNANDSPNWAYLDPNYVDFLEDKGFIDWRRNHGTVSIPEQLPHSLYGRNKSAFLAQAIQPALMLKVSRGTCMGFQLRTKGRSDQHYNIILSLLEDLNALPSKACVPDSEMSDLGQILKGKGIIVKPYEDYYLSGISFYYAPQGLKNPSFDFVRNIISMKNLVENILPNAFHYEENYQDILKFESRIEDYAEWKTADKTQKRFRKELDRLGGVQFPELEKQEFNYAGEKYTFRMPVWYRSNSS